MRTKRFKLWFLFLAIGFLLTACSLSVVPEEASGYALPQVWFDVPLPGSEYPLGDVQVVAHGADRSGVAEVELSTAEGTLIGRQPGTQSDTLLTAIFTWHPPEPGHYVLAARAMNIGGDWSEYTYTDVVIVGKEEIPPTPETIVEEEEAAPTPTPTTEPAVAPEVPETCTDRAKFVSETISDGTVFKPGDSFTKTWTLKNDGTCTWTTGYALRFYDGKQMSGPNQKPIPNQVSPGETITLSVNLTAPANPGTHRGNWMLMNEDGTLFGLGENGDTAFWVEIVVAREDTQAPSVEVTYAPNGRGEPTGRQKVTLTANATDNVKVVKIEIYLTGPNGQRSLLTTCNNTTTCSIEVGPLTTGDYKLQAAAYDAAGNQGNAAAAFFTVSP